MVVLSHLLFLAATATATASSLFEDTFLVSLLKRQEPGTPKYNCHSNCGTAISLAKAPGDVCKSADFLAAYANCLQCSGPENENIWRYYGRGLIPLGEACGLEAEPKEGEQPDVPEPPKVSSESASAVPTSATHVQETLAPSSDSADAAPTQTLSSSAGYHSSVTHSTSVTGVPTHSVSGTASFTASLPAQQTGNTAADIQMSNAAAIIFGAVAAGMAYGF